MYENFLKPYLQNKLFIISEIEPYKFEDSHDSLCILDIPSINKYYPYRLNFYVGTDLNNVILQDISFRDIVILFFPEYIAKYPQYHWFGNIKWHDLKNICDLIYFELANVIYVSNSTRSYWIFEPFALKEYNILLIPHYNINYSYQDNYQIFYLMLTSSNELNEPLTKLMAKYKLLELAERMYHEKS